MNGDRNRHYPGLTVPGTQVGGHGTLEAYCRCIDVGGMAAHKMELN